MEPSKHWWKEIKEYSGKFQRLRRFDIIHIVKISSNFIYRFNIIPVRILANYFVDTNKLIFKFLWIARDMKIQSSTEKTNVEGVTLGDFKTSFEVTVFKTV